MSAHQGTSYETIMVEVADGVATLTLNRPDRLNALNPAMLDELLHALAWIGKSREVNVLVLTGAGRLFCAGVDLDTPFFMQHVEDDSVFEGTRLLDAQHEMILAFRELQQPTIAMLNGDACGGGGLGMAMACDMRFAVSSARFWMVPSVLSVVQDFGLTWTLQRQIGSARAMEMVFSGERVSAEKAERWGFVNEVFGTPEELREHVTTLARQIGTMGNDATRLLKNVVRTGETSSLREQLRLEAISNGLCFNSEEFEQAKTAMLKRLNKA